LVAMLYDLNYYMLLKELINNYYYKNKIATIPFTKIEKVYRNMNYREKYHLKNMPNQEFIELSIVNNIGEAENMDQK